MRVLVTGSSGHLGEALVRVLRDAGDEVSGLDLTPSRWTDVVGSVTDVGLVRRCVERVDAVVHTATLHKPHLATHRAQDFVDTNVTGTLNLLEAAASAAVSAFVFTSTTSAFGRALSPDPGSPAAWITERVTPAVKNVYGASKLAAEDLCELVASERGLACVVLRVARFFPEQDDDATVRASFGSLNAKVNELLNRRVDLADVVGACRVALARAGSVGFGRFVVSATTPFCERDCEYLRADAPGLVRRLFPSYETTYAALGWSMFTGLDRVYDNRLAREVLGWSPVYDFGRALERLSAGEDPRSALSIEVGAKGYHREPTGIYTTR